MESLSRLVNGSYEGYRVSVQLVREAPDYEPVQITDASDVYRFLSDIQQYDREVLYSLHLDGRSRVVGCEEVSRGCLTSALVHPREVYKAAILGSAASIIVAHNHPSGDPTPSPEDVSMSKQLSEAGRILGIELLDSIVIGDGSFYSLRGAGFLG